MAARTRLPGVRVKRGGAPPVGVAVTAGERERQSLEPLLATPSSREAIMSGKIAAACLYVLLLLSVSLPIAALGLMLGAHFVHLCTALFAAHAGVERVLRVGGVGGG